LGRDKKLREELNAQVLALRKDGEAMRLIWEEIRKLRGMAGKIKR
jgi:hypothetical protein